MKIVEQAEKLLLQSEIKEASTNLLEDIANAVLGDITSIGKIIFALTDHHFLSANSYFGIK